MSCVVFLKGLLPWCPWLLLLCFHPDIKFKKIISVCYQNFGKSKPSWDYCHHFSTTNHEL